jgi:plasmid stabilization system protein ParE
VRIQWSPRALEQAETAFDHIAEDRPQAAQDWLFGLFERVELLLQFPEQGRTVPEADREDLREVIYEERHRVVYRVDPDWIHVLLVHPSPIPMSPEELDDLE